jgi:(2Fe-2S) ferredoxin
MTAKIGSLKDLNALRDRARAGLDLREGPKPIRVTVHMGTCGIASGARDILAALAAELEALPEPKVTLKQAGCAGLCEQEPMISVVDAEGRAFKYGKLDAAKIREIVRQHLVGGTPVVECVVQS